MTIATILVLIISLTLVIVSVKVLLNMKGISENGVEVSGVIVDRDQFVGVDSNISFPVVRFLTKESDWITKTSMVSVIPGIYKKGDPVTVVYQNSNPNNFYIKDKITYLVPIAIIIAATIVAVIALICLINK